MTLQALVDQAAEDAVLGAILLHPQAIRVLAVEERLTPHAFHNRTHRLAYEAALALADRDEGIDTVTVTAELERTGRLEEAGGRDAIDQLAVSVPLVANFRSYARRVLEMAERRVLREAGFALAHGAQDNDREQIERAERLLASRHDGEPGRPVADLVFEWLASPELDVFELPWKALSVGCGGGLRRQQVTAVGGWTGHGKSVLTDQVLAHVATRHPDVKVHLYINEMSREERALRNAAREADVSYSRLTMKQLTDEEHRKVLAVLNRGLPFEMTDCAGWSAQEIARDIRWRRWDLAGVDILHNIEFETERDVANAMQVLVAAAMQASCHLLVTVHLNEQRATGEILPPPVKRDIRGSGMVKNLAHNVLFVYRDMEEIDGDVGYTGDARLYWEKTRSGQGGFQRVRFNGDRQRLDFVVR